MKTKSSFTQLLVTLLALLPLTAAATDNNIPTTAENPFVMENGELHGNYCYLCKLWQR